MSKLIEAAARLKEWEVDCESARTAGLSVELPWSRFVDLMTVVDGTLKKKRFNPPTVEEVASYCEENEYRIDPNEFVDFYTSKGWKVGTASMKCWKSAVRRWARTQNNGNATRFAWNSSQEQNPARVQAETGNFKTSEFIDLTESSDKLFH